MAISTKKEMLKLLETALTPQEFIDMINQHVSEISFIEGNNKGYARLDGYNNKIALNPVQGKEEFVKTLMHELIHISRGVFPSFLGNQEDYSTIEEAIDNLANKSYELYREEFCSLTRELLDPALVSYRIYKIDIIGKIPDCIRE